jgi:hypothetical protein
MDGMSRTGEGAFVTAFTYSGTSGDARGSRYAVGDVDGDGFMEVVNTGGGQIWCFNHNGSAADYFPMPWASRDDVLSSPVLGDVDGDGSLDIIVGGSDGNVEAYGSDGTMLDGFPLTTGATEAISPTLLDLDGDGDIEVAAVSGKGFLYVWDLPGIYSEDTVPWGYYRHDPQNSGMNPQRIQPPEPATDWMPASLAYNYPNPASGDFTTIRYRLEQPAQVRIEIYDLAGERVAAFSGPGEGQTDNEVVWGLGNVESGVYFCQVHAESALGRRVTIFKIAVSK